VQHAEGQLIIRRAPHNAISDSASKGIAREYQMLHALKGRAPVPEVVGFCADSGVLGGAFIVMECVDGVSITTTLPEDYPGTPATLNRIGEELVDALATIHNLEWQSLGLNRPAPPADYLRIQIERWIKARAADPVRDLPLMRAVGEELLRRLPPAPRSTVLHGDYHLDNTLFRRNEPTLAAVIDWELASVGDPLADLGLVLGFWGPRRVDPPGFGFVQRVSCRPGLITRHELARRWSNATGIGIEDWPYYCAYALWRLAAIVEGAFALQAAGKVDSDYARDLEMTVPRLLAEADILLRTA
jgi:aminoglycoside phosphotransferase (APT) family kinase protein